jgi:hypothetical protein
MLFPYDFVTFDYLGNHVMLFPYDFVTFDYLGNLVMDKF